MTGDAREIEHVEGVLGHVVNARGALPADAYSYGPGEIAVRRLPAGSAAELECLTSDGRRFVLSCDTLASETAFQAALIRHAGYPLVLRALRRPSGQLIAAQTWAGAIAEMLGNGDRLADAAILLPGGAMEELLGEVVLGAERDAITI